MSTRRSGPSWRHFYPRSPCGERPLSSAMSRWACLFLSTLSLRRATKACRTWTYERLISIHALLAESDGASSKYMSYGWDFYPRSPCGERRSAADLPRPVQDFYPRSPCGERQVLRYGVLTASLISIHALLAESDRLVPDYT